jgi:hypothetical protein
MATYVEHARTNYFKVKDEAAFKKDMERFQVTLDKWQGRFAVLFDYYVPTHAEDEETGEEFETDFMVNWVAPHLQEDSIAVLSCIGYEGMRYVGGYAQAVDHDGDEVWLNLLQINKMARAHWGKGVEIDEI